MRQVKLLKILGRWDFFSVKVGIMMRNLLNINMLWIERQSDIASLFYPNCNILHKICEKLSNGSMANRRNFVN